MDDNSNLKKVKNLRAMFSNQNNQNNNVSKKDPNRVSNEKDQEISFNLTGDDEDAKKNDISKEPETEKEEIPTEYTEEDSYKIGKILYNKIYVYFYY